MNISFIEGEKKTNYYDVLLPHLAFKYVKNYYDGFIYAFKEKDIEFNDLINFFLSTSTTIFKNNSKYYCCLCLLVNPYFDNLYDYILKNIDIIEKKKLNYLKTNIFEKLANPTFRLMMNNSSIQGSEFYIEHSCYEKSKNIIKLIK